jgi:hypothetical protein
VIVYFYSCFTLPELVTFSRFAGAPSCSKTPVAIAESIRELAKAHNMEVKVLGKVIFVVKIEFQSILFFN